ncbi:MAG: DUF3332 domain-containing protein [Prevotellaceae bacterium]|jgi:hypothetical protein|nr:DUF3332 domain-containing protein [Prevotellaceae bacterium]
MRKLKVSAAVLMLGASAMMMSSCLGSFGLFKRVLSWNQRVTNEKWVNELVFLVFCVVPVYEFAWLIDSLVLNSIEFWTGSSPMAGVDKVVRGEKGDYHVKSITNGYRIELLGSNQKADLLFDPATQTWSMNENGTSTKLVTFVDGDNTTIHFGNAAMTVNNAQTAQLMTR